MYTIDRAAKLKFFDSSWMPIPVGENTPNPIQSSAGCGDVEVIKQNVQSNEVYKGVSDVEIKSLEDKVNRIESKMDKIDEKLDKILIRK